MKLIIRLTTIKYKGSVGRNWSFELKFDKFTFPFNAEVASGVPCTFKNKPVYFDTAPNTKSKTIAVGLKATERDLKFPESGTSSTTFRIDLASAQPQKFSLGVDVKENRGPKVKTKATGHLDLDFVATVGSDDDACMNIGNVEFELLDSKNGLTAADIKEADRQNPNLIVLGATVPDVEIFCCMYKEQDNWRISPVLATAIIRWGSIPKRFRDIVFPGSSRKATVNCATVDEMLEDVAFHIKDKIRQGKKEGKPIGVLAVPPPAKGQKIRWHMREAIEAHERVHVREFGDLLKARWPGFQKRINEYIIGSVKTMTFQQADKATDAYLTKLATELSADVADVAGEVAPRQAEVLALRDIQQFLIAFKKDQCGPKGNSKKVTAKTSAKRTAPKKKTAAKKTVKKKTTAKKKR